MSLVSPKPAPRKRGFFCVIIVPMGGAIPPKGGAAGARYAGGFDTHPGVLADAIGSVPWGVASQPKWGYNKKEKTLQDAC